ncbi:MAG: 4Fe-4S dicluster domain-containing protein [Deltaproteobacteria bacterium]|nr:4Fe-4S dicluster domain-containing protein [Deltaproteobacteria bacterium]MBW2285846.1 4Fe-4S dicluster domain-containing protein [Deltaproteobacteria bacterium]
MSDKGKQAQGQGNAGISRRNFLKLAGGTAVGVGVAGVIPRFVWLDEAVAAIPASGGYLLVDTKKCQGCVTCMLACSLVHEGVENQSLARIQVIQNPFEKFPHDITLAQCRQCLEPACIEACEPKALHVDGENGNVRTVDEEKCIACMACIEACPFTPARVQFNHVEGHAQKCDLCAEAPFWQEKGGPDGKQACVELCPVGAISFTKELPAQEGDAGYEVNLRGAGWKALGYTTK